MEEVWSTTNVDGDLTEHSVSHDRGQSKPVRFEEGKRKKKDEGPGPLYSLSTAWTQPRHRPARCTSRSGPQHYVIPPLASLAPLVLALATVHSTLFHWPYALIPPLRCGCLLTGQGRHMRFLPRSYPLTCPLRVPWPQEPSVATWRDRCGWSVATAHRPVISHSERRETDGVPRGNDKVE